MKIAYIAGPMTPKGKRTDTENGAIEFLLNIRDLIGAAHALIRKGYAPYCPGLDFQYYLTLPAGAMISEDAIKGISMAFLEAADCAVFLPRWETSRGAEEEYARAIECGMPIFFGVDEVPNETL